MRGREEGKRSAESLGRYYSPQDERYYRLYGTTALQEPVLPVTHDPEEFSAQSTENASTTAQRYRPRGTTASISPVLPVQQYAIMRKNDTEVHLWKNLGIEKWLKGRSKDSKAFSLGSLLPRRGAVERAANDSVHRAKDAGSKAASEDRT